MENEIQLFNSPEFGQVRTAGTPDNPLFCLSDICKAVELTNPSSVKQRLDPEDVQLIDLHTLNSNEGSIGTNPYANFVTESGLYDAILQSSSPKVRPFRKWLTSEVLPSIRKTGGYIPAKIEDTPEEIMAKAILVANKTMELQKQRIQALEGEKDRLTEENKLLTPKAQYTDEVLQSTSTYTHTQMAKELNFRSVNVFLQKCQADNILYKQSGVWMPYSRFAGKGYMKMRTTPYRKSDGSMGTNTISVWTEEGRLFLHRHFNVAMQPIEIEMNWEEALL